MKVIDNFLYESDGKKVRFMPSPNVGKAKKAYKLFVIHFDAASARQGLNWMLDKNAKVSAELWLSRTAELIQLVPFNITAWHCGESTWRGMTALNSVAIGIELQNTGVQEYTKEQMTKLGEIARALVSEYDLEIVGHEDIAPLRKVDPSGSKVNLFDWKQLFDLAGVDTASYKTTSDLNLRRGQGTSFPAVTTLKKGIELFELNRVGEWSKIQVKGSKQSGWVNNKYLTK